MGPLWTTCPLRIRYQHWWKMDTGSWHGICAAMGLQSPWEGKPHCRFIGRTFLQSWTMLEWLKPHWWDIPWGDLCPSYLLINTLKGWRPLQCWDVQTYPKNLSCSTGVCI